MVTFFEDERFLWDHSFETQFREIPRNFVGKNSSEFLRNTSPEIPEKFLVLGHQVHGFLGELNKRINFEKFLGISPGISPQEIPEKFY